MKKISFLASLVFVAVSFYMCGQGSEKTTTTGSGIEFDTISHSFGELPFNAEAEFEFVFTNSGEKPLILNQVKSTCGCTVPEWSGEPINAGQKGSIRVSYDTHRVGVFSKTIYVYSNAENGVIRLTISGKVNPMDS